MIQVSLVELQRNIKHVFDMGKEYGKEKGLAKGAYNAKIEIAKNLLAMNVLTTEQILKATGLDIDTLNKDSAK